MPLIKYQEINLSDKSLALIRTCNQIIAEYTRAGYVLTLRQLYYQLVSRDVILNKQSEYKRVGSIVNDGRLAGLIDWDALEDRTRNVRALEPRVLSNLIRAKVAELRDEALYEEKVSQEDNEKALLGDASDRWEDVVEMLERAR